MNRTVELILPASKSFLPGDFVVHRALPRRELRRVGGFVFLDHFDQRYDQPVEGELASRHFSATPLELFTHVLTHEFHHKGQILVLGRAWGYEPVDTDVLR